MFLRFFFLFLILNSAFGYSQKYSFVYEYNYKPDTLNLNNTETELMYLFVDKTESIYVSLNRVKRDSAISAKSRNGSMDMSVSLVTFPQQKVNDFIVKNYKSKEIISYKRVSLDKYKLIESHNLNWNISDSVVVINDKKCQLASTEFKGRKYKAWFTNEIPISDGPYKFSGLPGLIVKIEDEKKEHIWELKAIEKYKKLSFNLSNYVTTTNSKYKKALQNYIDDPNRSMREFRQKYNVVSSTITTPDGQTYSDVEYDKMKKKSIQEEYKKKNNLIEIE